jgi:amino acid adenylation domain-containing protein
MLAHAPLAVDRRAFIQRLESREESLAKSFERAAELHHFRAAIGCGAWQATYRELNIAANRLAHALLHRGTPGDRIAVLMLHDGPAIAAVLGTLKADRIIVALHPGDPPIRLKQLMADAEPSVLITDFAHRELARRIIGPNCELVYFEDAIASGCAENPSIATKPEQTAFLAYTSGSTGRPKAVMMTHSQFQRNVLIHTEAMEYTADDRIPLFGSLRGGQAVTLTWCALLNGAALYPFPVIVKGVAGLAGWMMEHDITIYVSSASIFRSFVKTLANDFKFLSIRAVRLASEPVTAEDFGRFQKHFTKRCLFVHTLSCSETCNIAVSRRLPHDQVADGCLPIGVLSNGIEVLFLNDEGQPVAPGQVGEIVVKSRYVAAGYWRNPTLTAERFSEDLDGNGTRLVHTGDLGRINSHGMLEFCGRKDALVKIRGNRIELSEIERALLELPGVSHAAVEAIARESHEPALVGYVVSNTQLWSPSRLRSALRGTLPDYMVPSKFVVLDEFPFTPSGKVDRQKLRQIAPSTFEGQPDGQPWTDTESLLAKIWTEAFGVEISRNADFFDLGGDSLIAAVVGARIHAELGIELNMQLFVDYPILAEFASSAIDERPVRRIDHPSPLLPARSNEPAPLSFCQERLWYISQTVGKSSAYTTARAHRILGPLDIEILRACTSYICGRHEIMRTTFAEVDGRPVQIVHPARPIALPFLDLTGSPDPEIEAALACKTHVAWIFDLTRGPLIRFFLIRLREDEYWLLRTAHHIICDRHSWVVYFRELSLLYEAKICGNRPPLPEIAPLQYRDWAFWERQTLDREGGRKEAITWWRDTLSGSPRLLQLPFRRGKTVAQVDPAEGVIRWATEPPISQQLDAFAQMQGATPYMVRLAAFVALITAETGELDVAIGTHVTNRNRIELQNMFGYFANLATLRFQCEPQESFRNWLRIVRRRVMETQIRSGIPYEELRKELLREGVTMPEISVIFSISHHHEPVEFAGLKVTRLKWLTETMPWGFSMNLDQDDAEHDWCTSFDARIYDPVGVHGFIDRFHRLLCAVSREPDFSVAQLVAMASGH